MIGCVVLTVSASDKLREIFWGHIIYYSLGALFLVVGLALINASLKAMNAPEPGGKAKCRRWLMPALSSLWFLLCSLNGLQALVTFALPSVAGLAGERFLDKKTPLRAAGNYRAMTYILFLLVATCVGVGLGGILGKGIPQGYFDAYSGFSAPGDWFSNLSHLMENWLTLLGVDVTAGDRLTNAAGIANLLRIGFGLLLAAVPVAAALCYRRFRDRSLRILVLTHWALAALLLFANVFGMLSNANWRLSPLVASSVIVLVAFSRWLWKESGFRRMALIPLIPALVICLLVAGTIVRMPKDIHQQQGLPAVTDYLETQGLTYGFGTFWNANAVTVLSDSAVKVRDIEIVTDRQTVVPRHYQSQGKWYEPQEGQDRYFLLLTRWEYDNLGGTGNPLLASAAETLEFQDYRIVVLPSFPFS